MTGVGVVGVTMAGFGSRFAAAGYTEPKYRIAALGRPLFDWSMLGLSAFRDAGWRFSFAVRRADAAAGFIRARCAGLGIAVGAVVELDAATDGQATTALMLAERSPALPFAVFNIDTFVRPGAMDPLAVPAGCEGWIPCFPGPGDGWSFARTDGSDRVLELREKVRIGPHATVGLYWFGSGALFADSYRTYFGAGGREEKGERYVAPLYNQLIAEGRAVRIASLGLDEVGMLGTPAQVAAFVADPPASALAVLGR